MRRARFATTVVVAALTAVGLLASGGAAQTRPIPRVASPVTVKMGSTVGSMSVAGVYVASEKGYFRVIQILQKHSSVKDRAICEQKVLPGIHPDGEVNVPNIREALEAFKATGEVKPDIDLDKMLDRSFVRYAREVLGRYER